jgi:chromosome segregation ATPase
LLKLQIGNQQKEEEEFVQMIEQKEAEGKEVLRQLLDARSDLEELTKHVEGALSQLKDSEKENQRLANLVDVEMAKVMKLESEVEGQRSALEAGSDLEKKLASVTSRITESEARAADLTIKLGEVKVELESKKGAWTQLSDELKEEQKLRTQGTTLAQRLQEDLERMTGKLDAAGIKHKELHTDLEKTQSSLEEEKKRFGQIEEELATSNELVQRARDERDLVVKQLEKANADAAAHYAALQKDLQDTREEREATVAKLTTALSANSTSAAVEISALQTKLEKNMDLLSDLTLQMAAKEEEMGRANLAQGEVLSGQIRKLQQQLEDVSQSKGSEVQDLMSRLKVD